MNSTFYEFINYALEVTEGRAFRVGINKYVPN